MKTSFEYDNGQTLCIIEYKDHYFVGQAHCHPDDEDFMSEKTGCFIAESRAHQKYLKFVKNCEILPKLEALNHLKSTLAVWENDTPNYFSRRLNSEIKNLEEDLMMCKRAIANEQQYLHGYIKEKDKLYKRIRLKNGTTDNSN